LPKSVAASTQQLGKTIYGFIGFQLEATDVKRVVNRWEGREADGKVAGVEKDPQENYFVKANVRSKRFTYVVLVDHKFI
jgi:hypothetical protein